MVFQCLLTRMSEENLSGADHCYVLSFLLMQTILGPGAGSTVSNKREIEWHRGCCPQHLNFYAPKTQDLHIHNPAVDRFDT